MCLSALFSFGREARVLGASRVLPVSLPWLAWVGLHVSTSEVAIKVIDLNAVGAQGQDISASRRSRSSQVPGSEMGWSHGLPSLFMRFRGGHHCMLWGWIPGDCRPGRCWFIEGRCWPADPRRRPATSAGVWPGMARPSPNSGDLAEVGKARASRRAVIDFGRRRPSMLALGTSFVLDFARHWSDTSPLSCELGGPS